MRAKRKKETSRITADQPLPSFIEAPKQKGEGQGSHPPVCPHGSGEEDPLNWRRVETDAGHGQLDQDAEVDHLVTGTRIRHVFRPLH